MKAARSRLSWIILAPMVIGCGEDPTCLQGAYPAIIVRVTGANGGGPILGATGEVLEGSFRENLFETGPGYYQAAENRPGTYAVHLERAGYSPWDTAGVFVQETGGSCSTVMTEQLQAVISPVP
jgi:hypothetical protein